jgi:glucose/arabinose dehydrogenase
MLARFAIYPVVFVVACKGEPDRAISHVPTHEAPVVGEPAAPGAALEVTPVDSRPAAIRPPPGTSQLAKVPAAIAAKVELREVVRGLARPVALVAAPGDPRRRLFIVEQHAGRIRILENGKLAQRPFFKVGQKVSTGNEQGLLGLAFHPRFADNGKLYVNYTAEDRDTHIVEYRVSATDPDLVDMTTARELIEIDQPYSNHNGGNLEFGPDGRLYAGLGDGGAAGDPKNSGQTPTALLGKMLAFDVDAARPKVEIVHMGLRNPWRHAFDVTSGGLYIADVGQNAWEYVFVVPLDSAKRNFGWNVVEGNHCYGKRTCDRTGFTPPVADYPHAQGCSITGGFVYRGKALPELVGRYFYADYCTGLLRSFVWTKDPSSPTAAGFIREHWDWKPAIDRRGILAQVSSFGVDHDGELYIVLLTGAIYRLAPRP